DLTRSADRDDHEQSLDVFRIEADAAVTHYHADSPRDVGSVDTVQRKRHADPIVAKRVVGISARSELPGIAALSHVLCTDARGDHPLGLHGLLGHRESAAWPAPL